MLSNTMVAPTPPVVDMERARKMTNIHHIAAAPTKRQAYVHFWGCNFNCLGCLCKRWIYDFMLKESELVLYHVEPKEITKPPERFLDFEEVMRILEELGAKWILLEGQEASLDPLYPQMTEAFHKRLGSHNVLLTNAYEMPPLKDTDRVEVSIKAFTDSLHRHYTGKSNKRVLRNFVSLHQSGMKLSVATVLIPDCIDIDETEHIAKFIANIDKDIPYHIFPYFTAGDNPWRQPTAEEIDEAASVARRHLNKVHGWKGDEEPEYEVVRIV